MVIFGLSAIGALTRSWWKAALGALLIFPLAFGLGQCSGKRTEKAAQEARQQAATLKATEQARTADAALVGRKSTSDATIAQDRKASDAETANIPDQAPSDRLRRDACFELRRTGQVDASTAC